jgi:hypothetical protein
VSSGHRTAAPAAAIDARYGRTPQRRRRAVIVAVLVGAAVLATAVVWVVWVGLFTPGAAIDNQDVGYSHVDASTLSITEQISADPGTRVTCSFEAVDEKFAIVGWKVVDIPPSTARTFTHTVTVRISQPAVNGTVGGCWLTKG